MRCIGYVGEDPEKRRYRWTALLAVGIVLAGCASFKTKQRMEELDRSINAYTSALRWGHYEDAAAYRLHRDKRPVRPLNQERFEGIRIISCEEAERALNKAQTEAAVSLSISYYFEDAGIAKTITDRQLWWFDPAQEHWFLDGDLPYFLR